MKKFFIILIIIIIAGSMIFLAFRKIQKPAKNISNPMNNKSATIKTNLGEIEIIFYDTDAPKTVQNFINLAEKGFYNDLIFHRVVKNFVIQGGDPFCNITPAADSGPCGAGDPGYKFEDELNPETESYKNGYKKGVVAMANSGPNTNGSQFFIMLQDVSLPNNYTIFGKVADGQGVVDKIGVLPVNQNDRPVQPAIIKEIIIK